MPIQYRFLTQDDFPEAHATMLEAFSDYQLDMSYMTPERSWRRNLKSGVHYDCSVGAYQDGKMVGLTFVGLDDWLGEKAAFDSATGIIPGFRGQGIAKAMFEFILPRLRDRGVSTFLLEVLQPNKAAIRAYEKAGFKCTREFACLDIPPGSFVQPNPISDEFEIRPVDRSTVQQFSAHIDWQPSWENSFSGMDRIEDELIRLGAFKGGQCVGLLVYYPLLQWVMSLVVVKDFRRQGVASALMSALMSSLPGDSETVKISNIDFSDTGMLAFLAGTGAQRVIDQFEMEFRL